MAALVVVLSRTEIRLLINALNEALFELGDDEFAIRVGVSAEAGRDFKRSLVSARNAFDRISESGHDSD